ncbi:MAG: hypothetical protein U1F98_07440 [Verrucomicrobiota bacterium]
MNMLKSLKQLALASLLAAGANATATELLVNGNFNDPASGANPTAWTAWSWNTGWANHENNGTVTYDSSYYLVCGNNWYNGAGGFYQTIGGAEGITYTLNVLSGADAWWLPTGRMTLFFLDASDATISSATRNTVDPAEYGGLYDIAHPWSNYTLVATSPAGTVKVKVEFASAMPDGVGGSVWFENASLSAPINPPVISNIYPNGDLLWQATNKFSFTATSAVAINASGIKVILDGVDISGSLAITGAGTPSVSVSYSGLTQNAAHTAAITVTDSANLNAVASVTFDTYNPLFSWEGEDYDYNSRQYTNTPVLSNTPVSGSYFGVTGTYDVDYHDYTGIANGAVFEYRSADTMATQVTGDKSRKKYVDAGVPDYQVGWFDGASFFGGDNVGLSSYQQSEWVNYTRNFPAGTYNIVGRVSYGNGATASIPMSLVTGGWGTTSQTLSPLGAFRFPASGWGSYFYVPLTDANGNRVAVTLSGVTTLRVTAGSGGNLNFFMLVPVNAEDPTITGVYPDGATLQQGTNKMVFTVASASHSIDQSNVVLVLNGVTNTSLAFTGSSSSWNVSAPLSLNVTNYTAVIRVTDNAGNSHAITNYFDTFDPADYMIEAEDFDFDGGQYVDNPAITSAAAPNSYFDTTSSSGVDSWYGDVLTPLTAPFRMRSTDTISTDLCSDTRTRALVAAQLSNPLAFNYNVSYWSTNGWLNYTHNYPSGKFTVYARMSTGPGLTGVVQLDKLSGGTTNYLGTFTSIGRGYNLYDWVPLVNTNNGLPATLTLGGLAKLRATCVSGDVNPNSFLLVPAVVTPAPLQFNYSAGTLTLSWSDASFHLQAKTNTLAGAAWADYPGGGSSPVIVTIDNTKSAVFFRLSN